MSDAIMPIIRIKQFMFVLCLMMFSGSGFAFVVSPPTIAKSFSAASVAVNNSVTLTFTITNPNGATDLTGVSFNDTLPGGLIIANPDSLTGTCDPGVITPNVNSINLVGGTILAGSSCTFSIDVLAVSGGTQVNTTDPVTSNEGGAGNTATATLDVVTPDLTITKTHTGNFLRPQTGATYTITVTNSGGGDTSALVTVTDTLPSGLTATALDGGPNWTCTLAPLRCDRGDVLTAGASYDPITLTVSVAANAPASVTNTATVSGGGESNTSNDTASDTTQINPALALAAQNANVQVTAGSTASAVLNVTANSSGLGAITFTCSGVPAAASCTFNPTSVSATGQVTLNIATTAKSTSLLPPGRQWLPPVYLPLLALTGLATLMLLRVRKTRSRLRWAMALACFGLLALAGCGVNQNHTTHSTGTPPGTYAITVTANSASLGATATSTVNLTVQ
jgi:uncharacterized repeat protein (TIGR01451 family)